MTSQSTPTLLGPDVPGFPPLRIDIACPDEDTIVVTPTGEADICSVDRLEQALLNTLREDRTSVVVDLDQLTFMDAQTLNILVGARQRLSAEGTSLRVRCHARHHRRLLAVTGLDGMLDPGE